MKHSVSGRGTRLLATFAALVGFAQANLADAQTVSSLMFFNGSQAGGGLVFGKDGALYGVATESTLGGGALAGLLYRVTTDASQSGTLHQFGRLGNFAGGGPRGALTSDGNGNLYGVTAYTAINLNFGQRTGNGTVFKVTESGTHTLIYSFSDYAMTTAPFTNADGAAPNAPLLLANDGFLYGSTFIGGANATGTLFKLATNGSGFVSLHSFAANTGDNPDSINGDPRIVTADGGLPQSRLTQGGNGDLFGTTFTGGANGTGVIFTIHRDGTGFLVLREFDASPPTITDENDPNFGMLKLNVSGAYPRGGLVYANNGFLYGTTSQLGASGYGTLFRIAQDGSGFAVLKSFDGTNTGGNPFGELMVAQDGTIVGTASIGGLQTDGTTAGAGTLYSITLDGATFTTKYVFGAEGATPISGVVQSADGSFFGTTVQGSPYGAGTVYKFGTATNAPAQGTPVPIDNGGAIEWWLIGALLLLVAARQEHRRQLLALVRGRPNIQP